MTDTQDSTENLPLEAVLATLSEQLDTLSATDLPADIAVTLVELQHKLRANDLTTFQDITSSRATSRREYEGLMRFMTNAYLVTDLNLNIQEGNAVACRMLAAPYTALHEAPLERFFAPDERELLRERARDAFGMAGARREQEWESTVTRASGDLPVLVKTAVLRDEQDKPTGFQWLLQDISRRKQTNARLQSTYKLLLALVEASPLGIIMLDMQGRVQLWSEAAERILGWSQEEVLGEQPAHFPSLALERRAASAVGGEGDVRSDEYQLTCLRKDGTPILVRSVAAAIRDPDGEVIGRLEIFSDITKQHKLSTELKQMKSRLAASREAEQRRMARGLHDDVIQELIALQMELASHRRHAERGANISSGAELAQTFAHIESQVVATVRELRGVLREMRPAGLEEYGLVTALEGYMTQLTRQYADRPIEIRKQWPEASVELSLPIATCLFRVAQEALRNIMRHTTAEQVNIMLEQTSSHIIMEIRDDGAGFDNQPRFTQLAQEGHFGLVGMLERVELVGGQLEIQSKPGKGAAILVRIPLSAEE